jgi:hypothetical protein
MSRFVLLLIYKDNIEINNIKYVKDIIMIVLFIVTQCIDMDFIIIF